MMTRASNRSMALKKKMLMRNNMVLWMAAAALSTQTTTMIPTAQAAFVGPVGLSRRLTTTTTRNLGFSSSHPTSKNSALLLSPLQQPTWNVHQTTRLYSSKKDSSDSSGGILTKVKDVVKSFLPAKWFQSEKEKKAAIQRKIVKDEVKGSLAAILKDAPLPVRMIGNMIAPLMSTVMAGLAESMAEQQEVMEAVLKDARSYLTADAGVDSIIGSPIQLGQPISQSASTVSINGDSTSRVELVLPVTGSLGSGLVRLSASNGKIEKLLVEANGRAIAVDLSSKGGRRRSAFSGGSSSSSSNGGDIIEAEIIEKETKV